MVVDKVIEHGDGNCTLVVELEEDEVRFLLGYAIRDILTKEVERMEKENTDG